MTHFNQPEAQVADADGGSRHVGGDPELYNEKRVSLQPTISRWFVDFCVCLRSVQEGES
jgi:hypothetical protein